MGKRVDMAVRLVATAMDVPRAAVLERRHARRSDVSIARHLVWWLVRSTSDTTLADIGAGFKVTHATVINGIKRCEELRSTKPDFRTMSNDLKDQLSAACPRFAKVGGTA